jgi:glutamine synthetase
VCSSDLTDIEEQYNLLNELVCYFKNKMHLTPVIGAEIEFYLHGDININLLEQKIGCIIKPEKGYKQYEIDLPPSQNIVIYSKSIATLRNNIIVEAKKLGAIADFRPKPFLNDYGSAMHIHLNFLEDKDIEVEKYAQILCHYLPETLRYFLPDKDDYLRLDSRFMAPTHISYGGNNRSVLIRIPDSKPTRIEHRLAGANTDPTSVIYVILESIRRGLLNPEEVKALPKIFGNAFDSQYNLQKI